MPTPKSPLELSRNYFLSALHPLQVWASKPQAERDLEQIFGSALNWASAFRYLAAFRIGDYSCLPSVTLLPPSDMPGLWGGYSRDLRRIFISTDCPSGLLSSVLIEEIGHFLDQELCDEETPGDEGALFAALVLGATPTSSELETWTETEFIGKVLIQADTIPVEAAPKIRGSGVRKTRLGTNPAKNTTTSQDGSVVYSTKDSARIIQSQANQRIIGSVGNDTFVVSDATAKIEDPKGGTDTVESSVTFSILNMGQIENLTLTGTSKINATGNIKNNIIVGNAAGNIIDAGSGNDMVNGNAGDDSIEGGSGDDSLTGDAGNDSLEGGLGKDNLSGGDNNDTVSGGADNDALSGNDGNDSLSGGTGNDTLSGGTGNDVLDGGIGIDSLIGGAGDDTYIITDALDKIVESSSGGGIDTIETTQASFSMANYANVENLAYSGTGTGVAFTGNSGSNTITGTAGADSLDGGAGSDSLIGGAGNDTYFVDDLSDNIYEESGKGTDLVISAASSYTLANNVENLSLAGTAAINGMGNAMDNVVTGNIGDNFLSGGSSGNDTLFGSGGADTVLGESGNDFLLGDALTLIEDSVGTEISVTPYDPAKSDSNAIALAQNALGANSNIVITSAKFTGKSVAAGLLKDGVNFGSIRGESVELGAGFVLSTGLADTKGETTSGNISTVNGVSGSYLVNDILKDVFSSSVKSNDAATLEFKFTVSDPNANWISMKILFGSDEYPEFVSGFPDIAGVFIDGVNAALHNGDSGMPLSALKKVVDEGVFLDNATGEYSTAYDGITRSLNLAGKIGQGVNGEHTIKVVIADTNDQVVDSAIFVSDIKAVNSATFGLTIDQPFGNDSLLGGAGNDTLLGNAGDDTLLGGADDDSLDGGAGADSMVGGIGNDTFLVDHVNDIVVEDVSGGVDTVLTSISYDMAVGAEIEIGQLTGTGNASLGGSDSANTLVGNTGNNNLAGKGGDDSLDGGAGTDNLDGGVGNDTLQGGSGDEVVDYLRGGEGNDVYIVDSIIDVIDDFSGTDVVQSSVDFDLASSLVSGVENLSLSGGANINGTGTRLANWIVGNDGNNSLYGREGADTLLGGAGADTLKGGPDGSIDSLVGGADDDFYIIDEALEIINDESGEDTVLTTVSLTLQGNSGVENLILSPTLTGAAANISGTGNSLANSISGNAGNNSLFGGSDTLVDILVGNGGNDTLIGSTSTLAGDYLQGGSDDDIYIVSTGLDKISDLGGTDIVRSSVSYNLGSVLVSGLEHLIYTGSAPATLTGNDLDNSLTSESSTADTLMGGAGSDTLRGGGGADSMAGGEGNDFYVITSGSEIVYEESLQGDRDTALVEISGPTVFYTLASASTVENIIYTGIGYATLGGSHFDNTIVGGDNSNSLDGGDGNDSLVGGEIGDILVGGAGKDTLVGKAGADTLHGEADDDYYILDSQTDDDISDSGGIDTIESSVDFSLSFGTGFLAIENLVLAGSAATGTGNSFTNILSGNTLANTLSAQVGNDTIYGKEGADALDGGADNDLLFGGTNTLFGGTDSDSSADQLTGGTGNDSLDGGGGNDALYGGDHSDTLFGGSGNDLLLGDSNLSPGSAVSTSFDDSLVGGDGDDTLDGGGSLAGGNGDTLIGGKGNDLVYIRSTLDRVTENIGEGYDTLIANIDINLLSVAYANFEAVALYGTANNTVGGNNSANILYGNVGDNTLVGLLGNDSLYGGAGRDSLDAGEGNDYLEGGISAVLDLGDTMNGDAGNDAYVVYNRYDWIIDSSLASASADIDTVFTYVNFDPLANEDTNNVTRSKSFASSDTLSFAQLDRFVFMGDVIRGVGNAKANSITGNYENNVILGLDGNDTIFGGAGNDSIYGDRDRNFLSGKSTLPGSGYDSLHGVYPFNPGDYDASGLGNSSLFAATGTAGEGMDYLVGGDGNDLLSGNSKNDILIGGAGNDILYGGADIDSMVGGDGNDTFYKDSEDDIMVEGAGAGTDWVYSSMNIHQLQDNIENIVLYGALTGANSFAVGNNVNNRIYVAQNNIDQNTVTLLGGLGNDTLVGNFNGIIYGYAEIPSAIADISDRDADDYLRGGDGNDSLYGAQGNDTMEGGLGNDTIVMTSSFDSQVTGDYDRILEFGYEGDPTNGGIDWVISSVDIDLKDSYTNNGDFANQYEYVEKGMFIENLQGSNTGGQYLFGNWLNNTIVGDKGSDDIKGEEGNDFLTNSNSDPNTIDTLTGGNGADIFSLASFVDGATALYANDGICPLGAIDLSYAYIVDYGIGTDSILKPTILPDLNGDGQPAALFVSAAVNDPFIPGATKTGYYIDDVIINAAGFAVHTYNLIAVY